MESILVTGGTGTLGKDLVRRLVDERRDVRVLTRRSGGGARRVVGDLSTGVGLSTAVEDAATIIHCATTQGGGDVAVTRRLVEAARRAGGHPHLIYVSIVGIDHIGLPYYRAKLACERIVVESGLPWTIQRATQFHELVEMVFAWQRWSPVTLVARHVRLQPIDTRDVAGRLTELVSSGPSQRASDIGGPETLSMRELAYAYNAAQRRRRRVVSVRVPGTIADQFAAGHNLVPGDAFGGISFERFLTEGGAR